MPIDLAVPRTIAQAECKLTPLYLNFAIDTNCDMLITPIVAAELPCLIPVTIRKILLTEGFNTVKLQDLSS